MLLHQLWGWGRCSLENSWWPCHWPFLCSMSLLVAWFPRDPLIYPSLFTNFFLVPSLSVWRLPTLRPPGSCCSESATHADPFGWYLAPVVVVVQIVVAVSLWCHISYLWSHRDHLLLVWSDPVMDLSLSTSSRAPPSTNTYTFLSGRDFFVPLDHHHLALTNCLPLSRVKGT